MSGRPGAGHNAPLISVILPTFDRADLLPRSIASVLDQTFTDWELIIIDDGSTDNTAEVVAVWQQQSDRIRSVRQANQGGWGGPQPWALRKPVGSISPVSTVMTNTARPIWRRGLHCCVSMTWI